MELNKILEIAWTVLGVLLFAAFLALMRLVIILRAEEKGRKKAQQAISEDSEPTESKHYPSSDNVE
jgi:hypothetical protein